MNENIKIPLENYLDLLLDEDIDNLSNCPICVEGISDIIKIINDDLKNNLEGKFQKTIKKHLSLTSYFAWKNAKYPIPIVKLRILLNLWKQVCNKSQTEYDEIYNLCFQKANYFKAMCSPVNIKVIKSLNQNVAYFLGILYADGALRDIWLTYENERRFRWEVTITEEFNQNLNNVTILLEDIFNIKTGVKEVYNGRWHRILFQSMILHRLLNKLFEMPMGYKKGRLRIPQIIKDAPFEIQKYFLIGFFDGDGSCSNLTNAKHFTPVVALSQSSKEILFDLMEILEHKDLKFRFHKKTREKHVWYVIETKDKQIIKKFYEEFGFIYINKRERLKKLIESFEK